MNLNEQFETTSSGTTYWGKTAAGVMFYAERTGKIGLTLRSANVEQPGTYGVIGGAIDPQEDPKEAAARECEEEIGVRPDHLEVLDVFRDAEFKYTTFLARVPVEFSAKKLNWENDDFLWFSWNEIPWEDLHFGVAKTLQKPGVQAKLIKHVSDSLSAAILLQHLTS